MNAPNAKLENRLIRRDLKSRSFIYIWNELYIDSLAIVLNSKWKHYIGTHPKSWSIRDTDFYYYFFFGKTNTLAPVFTTIFLFVIIYLFIYFFCYRRISHKNVYLPSCKRVVVKQKQYDRLFVLNLSRDDKSNCSRRQTRFFLLLLLFSRWKNKK